MQPVRTSAATEVLPGLAERVTFHNAENGFSSCLRDAIRQRADGLEF
jgi:hypothetical protein